MKKNWAIGLIFIWHLGTLQAQYVTPGTGITWGMDDLVSNSAGAVTSVEGEYFINEDMVVSASDTVKLIENALVKFMQGKLITVKGVFQANPPDSILFTAADTLATYKSFRFEDSHASFLKNCRFEFGGGLDIVSSDLLIEGCTFSKNDKSNTTGVIDLFQCSPQIINCTFALNQGPAILSGANAACSPYIYGNTLYRNNTLNTNMPQINLGTSAAGVPIRIIGNTIEGFHNKAGGIAVTTLAGGNLDCVIDSNVIFNNRYGITAYGFDISSVISNNIIYDNNIENLPMQGGSGINYWGGTSNSSMVYGNVIHGNLWGITVTGDALPNMGQVEPDTVNPGKNRIYGNQNLGTVYALYNNTPNDMYAENNYWGSYDLDSVEMVIFHYPDDENLGIVDYMPVMDSLTTSLRPASWNLLRPPYPNPADNLVCLERPVMFDNALELEVLLLTGSGAKISRYTLSGKLLRIDVSELIAGTYVLVVSDGKRSFSSKFVKY